MASSDILLWVDTIKGESKSKADCIDIQSWSWGVSNSGSAALGGGMGSGKANFQDIHFSAPISKAAPALMQKAATGEHIKKATLHQRKAGGGKEGKEFLTITLEDILVSSYQTGASDGGGAPMDSFSFNYSKIKLEYKVQDEKGAMKAGGEFKYDVKSSKTA